MDAESFYARIATALGGPSPALHLPPPRARALPATVSVPQRRVWAAAAAERLRSVGGSAEVVLRSNLAQRVQELIGESSVVRVAEHLLPSEILPVLAHATVCSIVEPVAWREACAAATWGVTDANAWIAETGSVLLCAQRDRPRATSLLPRHHLVVVPMDRVIASLDEALDAMADTPSQWLLVTGPSRTSDIENDLTIGVHGPAVLHVLVVDEETA